MYARDTARIATPLGMVTIEGDDTVLYAITIGGDGAPIDGATATVIEASAQICAWFAGTRDTFDLPLAPAATERGAALRAAMVAIPHGETISYGALARIAASSPRAIGQACARNPFPIIVPCHRVLDANGGLGSYSAGDGPTTKRWLLDFERRHHPDRLF